MQSTGDGKTVDVLSRDERDELLKKPRPRLLPLAPIAAPARRHLPLANESRDKDRDARPIYAVWEITLACDLACRHCGSRAGHARPDELSTEQCLDLVRQMAEIGVREVTLIGGEAYLRSDWLEIVRAITARGMTATMTSGGRGIDRARAEAAKEAGLKSVSISLDGLEATHDRLRGVRGSHAAALAAMACLQRAGIPTSVNTQINRLSMAELPELLELLGAHGAHSWQLQLTVPMGRAADEPEVLLQPYDLLALFPMLAALRDRCDAIGVRMFPGNNIGYFGPHESKLRKHFPTGHTSSCTAGRYTLGIEADGTIKGCPSLSTVAWGGGNVRDNTLLDIWERATPLRYTRDRTVEDLWGYCRTCYYADTCRAGCTWTSDVFFGRPGNNPYCHHRAIEHQREGKRERLIKVEQAPGEPFDHGRFEVIVEELSTVG
jgi:radical SAM protein with 4Fe4S-binding SPASM domain